MVKEQQQCSLSHEDIRRICELVHQASGLTTEADQYDLIQRYVDNRIRANRMSADQYLDFLQNRYGGKQEMDELLGLILNHETFFFRDYEQLAFFGEVCLPEFLKRDRKNSAPAFKVWVAGCSTGEEAYSIAIILNVMMEDEVGDYQIVATDIDRKSLQFARNGLYSSRAERSIPPEYLELYLEKEEEGYRVHEALKKNVLFRPMNLVDRAALATMNRFDFVFCKNVLFYFNAQDQDIVLKGLYDALNPGGYLFVDYSTSIQSSLSRFEYNKMGKYFYQKCFE